MAKRCKLCGEETHTEDVAHLTQTDVYKLISTSYNIVGKSTMLPSDLIDFLSSMMGRPQVLVTPRRHNEGWFSSYGLLMRHESYPRPIKVKYPNGVIVWRTDHYENLPFDAKEYEARDSSPPIFSAKCPKCEETLELNVGVNECSSCNSKYEVEEGSLVCIMPWTGQTRLLADQIKIKRL